MAERIILFFPRKAEFFYNGISKTVRKTDVIAI